MRGWNILECSGIERSLCAMPSIYMIYTPFRYIVCDPFEHACVMYRFYELYVHVRIIETHTYTRARANTSHPRLLKLRDAPDGSGPTRNWVVGDRFAYI